MQKPEKKDGHGPPADIAPNDLWAQLSTMPRAHRVVDFPRYTPEGLAIGKVAIVVLTGDEVESANISAERHIREYYKKHLGEVPKTGEMSASFQSVYNTRATREVLFRACKKATDCEPREDGVCIVDHQKMSPFFPGIAVIGERLTTDEAAVLMNHYLMTQAEVGPIIKIMSTEEMDAWLEVLARGGSTAPLASLSSVDVNRLLMHSASRLYPSRTDTSLSGTPPDEPTPNE